jgi:hypothetical protein
MIRNLNTITLLLFSTTALAQPAEGQFIHVQTTTPGCNGLVTSSAKLANGDTVFGGTFTQCGAVRANRVVRFDGSQFFPLGSGLETVPKSMSAACLAQRARRQPIMSRYLKPAAGVVLVVVLAMAWRVSCGPCMCFKTSCMSAAISKCRLALGCHCCANGMAAHGVA